MINKYIGFKKLQHNWIECYNLSFTFALKKNMINLIIIDIMYIQFETNALIIYICLLDGRICLNNNLHCNKLELFKV